MEVVALARAALAAVIRGKPEAIDRLLVGVLAGGHVLIEDVPGTGKTTLAKTLARAFRIEFTRVQFTPDLLPTDILGSVVLEADKGTFSFRKGPIFTNVLLADEINRASPRTQSALLEAMSEGQVTVDGTTHRLPEPFFVLATQNPVDYQGTYPLPEAQLDRFILRFGLGYPSAAEELDVLYAQQKGHPIAEVRPIAEAPVLLEAMRAVREVEVKKPVAEYLLRVVAATRGHADLELGVSTRGAIALFRACQATAFLAGRRWVSPADVQATAIPALAHRLVLAPKARYGGTTAELILRGVLERVEVPA